MFIIVQNENLRNVFLPGSYAYSRSLAGDWSMRYDLGDETTYRSQPTWVLPITDAESGETTYWYLGDRWGGAGRYFESEYVLLPIIFEDDTTIRLEWKDGI